MCSPQRPSTARVLEPHLISRTLPATQHWRQQGEGERGGARALPNCARLPCFLVSSALQRSSVQHPDNKPEQC